MSPLHIAHSLDPRHTRSVLELHNSGTQLCDYSLEYCTALLMNLCLRTIGKQACPDSVFPTLLPLLQHDNQQVRHYINGTIYSLLSMPSHRTTAIDMKLDTTLRQASGKATPAFRRQYTFMLDLLISSVPAPQSDDDESDAEVDESEIVPETVEEREDVTSDLVGEGLLCQQYLIIDVSQARREGEADEAKISHDDLPIGRQHSQDSGAVLRRAVTPSMMQRPDPRAQEMSEEEMKAVEELRCVHFICCEARPLSPLVYSNSSLCIFSQGTPDEAGEGSGEEEAPRQ